MPAITLITAIPTFVSAAEHTRALASTPSSFGDIPAAVLRHRQEGVAVALDPPLPEEVFGPQDAAGGVLLVLTSVLVYMSNTGRGFQIAYPAITLHAVSRGEAPPGPSIYCQLDEGPGPSANGAGEGEEDVPEMRELSIIPQDPGSLDQIFEALSQCASLHPDPADQDDDEDDGVFVDASGGGFETFDGDEEQELSEVGRAALAHLESIIYDPHDHEEEEEEEEAESPPPSDVEDADVEKEEGTEKKVVREVNGK